MSWVGQVIRAGAALPVLLFTYLLHDETPMIMDTHDTGADMKSSLLDSSVQRERMRVKVVQC